MQDALHQIRWKLCIALVAFGIVAGGTGFIVYQSSTGTFEKAFREPIRHIAVAVGDVIDRNLFERYGDVQAFGLNAAAHDPANFRRQSTDNQLIRAMNGYMTGYGIYRLMVLVDRSGNPLAVNTVDGKGNAIDTRWIMDQSFGDAEWFKRTMAGEFLQGTNGFTGTAVLQPARNDIVGKLYGDDGYVITFAAPVTDPVGNTIGVWVNFADFGLVEEIVSAFYGALAAQGQKQAEITVLDPQGRIIVDYDPVGQGWTTYRRNPEVIGTFNLAEAGVGAAQKALTGETGSGDAMHARKNILQASGYAHTKGAYDYPGLKWSVLVRIPSGEAYGAVETVTLSMEIAILAILLVVAVAGFFIGTASAKPINAMTEAMRTLAGGDLEVEIPARTRKDEIGSMAEAVQVFKDNMIESRALQEAQAK